MNADVPPPPAADRVRLRWDRFYLPNGLTVIVHENRATPLVTVAVWYKVGAKDEAPGKTGLAHLFEHLMFGGSANMPGSYLQNMGQVGAIDMNGTTNADRTNFYQTVQAGALDAALFAESDRMGHFLETLGPEVLEQQRAVVLNEKREAEGAPYGRMQECVSRGLFPPDHPYAHTTLGWQRDVETLTLEDAHDWFRRYYAPSNAVLVLAGDIDRATAEAKAMEFFGDIPPGLPVQRPARWVPAHRGERREVLEDAVPRARLFTAWHIPPAGDPDCTCLSLVAPLLAGPRSRLYRTLVEDRRLATGLGAGFAPAMLAGQFALSADLANGADLATLEAGVRAEVARFLRDGPDPADLERLKINIEAGQIRGLQTGQAVAEVLAMNETFFGDPDTFQRELDLLMTLGADDLRQAAQRWLGTPDYTLHIVPRGALCASGAGIDRRLGPEIDSPGGIDLPPIREAHLSNGIRVLVAERHDLPLVECKLVVPRGAALEPRDRMGAAQLTAQLMGHGAGERDEEAFRTATEDHAIMIGAGIGPDFAGVGVSTLASRLSIALELQADMIRRPRFDEAAVEKARRERLEALATADAAPAAAVRRRLPGLLFGDGHDYARLPEGLPDRVAAITRDDLAALHRAVFAPAGATFIVAGDTTLEAIRPRLETLYSDWSGDAVPAAARTSARPVAPGVHLIDCPGAAQTALAAALVIPPPQDVDPLALSVIDMVLGGTFGSRINMNLREDKGWTYGVRTEIGGTLGERLYTVTGAVQADRTAAAMAEIVREYTELVTTRPVDADALALVRQSMLLGLPIRIQTLGALLGSIEALVQLGRPLDHWSGYAARLAALDLDAVNALARRLIRPDRLVWIIAGDRAQIEAEVAAGGFGPLHIVAPGVETLYR